MLRSAAFLLLGLFGLGCIDEREVIILMDERFEDPLDEWVVTGDTEIVTTYHAGEHALRFRGPAVLQRGINVPVYGEYQDGNWIEYTSDCDQAPTVRLERRLDLSWEIVLELPTPFDSEGWERIFTTVPPITNGDPYQTAWYSQLTVVSDGGCFIDNLRLMQPLPDDGW